jgi:hypothetical protein
MLYISNVRRRFLMPTAAATGEEMWNVEVRWTGWSWQLSIAFYPYSVMANAQLLPKRGDAVLYCVRIGLPLQNSELETVGTVLSIYRCEMELNEAERIGYEGRQEWMVKGTDKWGRKGNKRVKRQDEDAGAAGGVWPCECGVGGWLWLLPQAATWA